MKSFNRILASIFIFVLSISLVSCSDNNANMLNDEEVDRINYCNEKLNKGIDIIYNNVYTDEAMADFITNQNNSLTLQYMVDAMNYFKDIEEISEKNENKELDYLFSLYYSASQLGNQALDRYASLADAYILGTGVGANKLEFEDLISELESYNDKISTEWERLDDEGFIVIGN